MEKDLQLRLVIALEKIADQLDPSGYVILEENEPEPNFASLLLEHNRLLGNLLVEYETVHGLC
jgi:hypothetical protein